MYSKKVCVAIVVFLSLQDLTEGRKSRRNQKPKSEEDTTLQPSVVSYSTFGFNDVGSYDGFVPSSPDYANYLTNVNQETATRLYAPAFPTALDNTGFSNNYDSQSDGQYFTGSDSILQSSIVDYPKNINFYNTPSFENSENQNRNIGSKESFKRDPTDNNAPVYGTKLGSKNKKLLNQFNDTAFNIYSSGPMNPSGSSANFNFHHGQDVSEDKPSFGESVNNYQNNPSHVGAHPTYQSANIEDFVKPESPNSHGSLKFPKVIDFTKMTYPTEIENKYTSSSFNAIKNIGTKNEHETKYDDSNNKFMHSTPMFKDSPTYTRNQEQNTDKHVPKSYINQEYTQNFINPSPSKNNYKEINSDYKDNIRYFRSNYSNEDKAMNPHKGYEYSTNYSNISFKYDIGGQKKPFNSNIDEVVPASSNVVDLAHYQFPDVDYSNFKKIPDIKDVYDDAYSSILSNKNKAKPTDYLNQFKNMYTSVPSTSTNWGNIFKSTDYSSYKNHVRKPIQSDDISSDVVHIPKRPQGSKYHNSKDIDYTISDISSSKIRSHNSKIKPIKENWNPDIYNSRFKTEEDLLGLRNHDTSHPSYLPTFRPSANELNDDNDYYKKLVEKWRQSYWKSKFKNSYPDFESYSSEAKPVHVPVPKPYPIEIPHPVIVPVPQPYPVRVPVPKPVAVPVIRELTVPIEKPVPYPVVKKVPYPVEKPVPVPVEKEVTVPEMQPYPVHIPHVRPVFHHSRPNREEFVTDTPIDDDDDYFPRPEGSYKTTYSYKKRPRSTRNRTQRPTRTTYSTYKKRARRPADFRTRRLPSTHVDFHYSAPYRHSDFDSEQFDEPSDYHSYCKRTGNC
ncbi:uncharacterized protein ACR2FA_003530 [Aphomia sociella]